MWNKLIYTIYKDKVVINEVDIREKIKKDLEILQIFSMSICCMRFCSAPNKHQILESNKTKIEKSIQEIGFENTANILSEAPSSKLEEK